MTVPWIHVGFDKNAEEDKIALERDYPGLEVHLLDTPRPYPGVSECFLAGPRDVVVPVLLDVFGWGPDDIPRLLEEVPWEVTDPADFLSEVPDSYLDRVDGHWYVIRYDRTLPQIHARDCATCAEKEN